ncbi:sugar phosphate isomerase/epimerase family protein [Brachybacterium aquaticum]|uniref:Sugar phosphate isomerase/epimerase n=1 Tax=Brachybacterium aquaticum TaxID=1432564 RepID=A0A841A8X1_9MICO|nr:sugar phosphate isomerase/epimerase [Brachybacterium aquaticum]MBB5831276.1 sugar phosphate isomerase/epimerase [Brachybacterium aquaticum]
MTPRRDSESASTSKNGARKPFTRANSAHRSAREALSRRLSAGDPRSEQDPQRRIPVGLSTSSVFPSGVEEGFRLAAEIGYDGMEVMVSYPKDSQDPEILREYSERYELPILSLHAPTLFFLQGLWGREPWVKIERTIELAKELEVPTIVAHPPFRWQGKYARGFVDGVARLEQEHGIAIAVENMYPWRLGVREVLNYLPDHDPTDEDYEHVTVDLSHAATAGDDALEMIERLGDRLTHLHLADGSGNTTKDEHLAPGEGSQPCAEVLRRLANRGWEGSVLLEVTTSRDAEARERTLRQSLAFARHHLGHHLDGEDEGEGAGEGAADGGADRGDVGSTTP